jgi:hypothetical protein
MKGICKSCPRKAMHPLGNICRGCKTAQAAWKGHPSTKLPPADAPAPLSPTALAALEAGLESARQDIATGRPLCAWDYATHQPINPPVDASPNGQAALDQSTETRGTRRTDAERTDGDAPPSTSPPR